MGRWTGEARKPRAKETKPRKKRARETKKRKPYVKRIVRIAPKGDVDGLATQRKQCSKKKRSDRLLILEIPALKRYAEKCGISLRQAQRDRGQKLHKGCITKEMETLVGKTWVSMLDYYTKPKLSKEERAALTKKKNAMPRRERAAYEEQEEANEVRYAEGFRLCTHAALRSQVELATRIVLGKSQAARIAKAAEQAAKKRKPAAPRRRGASNDPSQLARNHNCV